MQDRNEFVEKLRYAVNYCSAEKVAGDTPDWIVAELLADITEAFGRAVQKRDKWFGHPPFLQPDRAWLQPIAEVRQEALSERAAAYALVEREMCAGNFALSIDTHMDTRETRCFATAESTTHPGCSGKAYDASTLMAAVDALLAEKT
jgi:hypothetical protein